MFTPKPWQSLALACTFAIPGYLHASSEDSNAEGDTAAAETAVPAKKPSPWLLVPTVSSNPKVGSSVGFLGGYLYKIDPASTSSMVALNATYSDTDAVIASLFGRTYWDGDRKRLIALFTNGKIPNDYDDYLGSGQEVTTTDNMKFAFLRYLQNIHSDWFIGAQAAYTNYFIDADNAIAGEILSELGLAGYTSGAVGLATTFDNRDNQNSPQAGMLFNASNLAYRESLGGEQDFDTYRAQFKHYVSLSERGLLAYRVQGRWTDDAPPSAYSSIGLRGYTRGQYLAPNSTTIEGEYRWRLKERFGINVFAGMTCLYGDKKHCDDSENIYTSIGIGGQYLLKPSEQMVISFDIAKGEGDNQGLYVRFGHSF